MLNTMRINKRRAPITTLYGAVSVISWELKLGIGQLRCSASTNLVPCEELVKNW
jgi:hypothetical protein